jgi:hypothetical protein
MPDFAERELTFVPLDDFKPFDGARRELLSTDRQQLHDALGCVPAAAGATLRGAAWCTALAEFWATQAAKTGDPEAAERAARLFKSASMERAKAWEMTRAFAASRRKSSAATPWFTGDAEATQDSRSPETKENQ